MSDSVAGELFGEHSTLHISQALQMQPLNGDILVVRMPAQSRTEEGVIIPEQARQKASRGLVVRVGPGEICGLRGERIPLSIEPYSIVLIPDYAGTVLEVSWPDSVPDEDRGDVLVMNAREVYAVLEQGRMDSHPGLAALLRGTHEYREDTRECAPEGEPAR